MSFKLYAVVKLKFSTPHLVNPILVCHWDRQRTLQLTSNNGLYWDFLCLQTVTGKCLLPQTKDWHLWGSVSCLKQKIGLLCKQPLFYSRRWHIEIPTTVGKDYITCHQYCNKTAVQLPRTVVQRDSVCHFKIPMQITFDLIIRLHETCIFFLQLHLMWL